MGTTPLEKPLPSAVQNCLRQWVLYRKLATAAHKGLGILGIAASLLAASNVLGYAQVWSVVAGICPGILAFSNPIRDYAKHARALRILSPAAVRYQLGRRSEDELISAMEQAERILTECEDLDDKTSIERARRALDAPPGSEHRSRGVNGREHG